MGKATAKALVNSLVERLEADSRSQNPRFGSLVSPSERKALRMMIENWGIEQNDSTLSHQKQPALTYEPEPNTEKTIAIDRIPPPVTIPPVRESKIHVDETALSLNKKPPNPECILCLDFGTAKSKAFAVTGFDEPEFFELPLGKIDRDLDNSVYAVSSSVWIDDDGLIFAGSEAVRRGMKWVFSGAQGRRRLDSLKQEISQVLPSDGSEMRLLGQDVNPTTVDLTYEDVITFYLAYLTDLATTELKPRVGTRYIKRRFALPWWEEKHRKWATELLSNSLATAQVVADTFHGKWHAGVHVTDLKNVLKQTKKYQTELVWLLERGVLEPLAAASSRLWADRPDRELILVVDVGAGTTDYTLFWTIQNPKLRRAFPVEPCGGTIKQAGDTLDSLLVTELLSRANLGADPDLRKRVSEGLYRRGIRQIKQTLFEVGEVTEVLANDEKVSMTKDEFLNTKGVARFSTNILQALDDLLGKVHPSWVNSVKERPLKLVLTGGGCSLPMIRSLVDNHWRIAGTPIKCRLAKDLPDRVATEFDGNFAREYPQLAVAMGGAMPMLLDERRSQHKWNGGAPDPGSLTQYPTRGI